MANQGLPVAGYKAQTDDKVALVNRNKEIEERVLRIIDELMLDQKEVGIDKRWLSVGRTSIEQGFMAINRAVFQPGRVLLPEDLVKHAVEVGCDVDQIIVENEADRLRMKAHGLNPMADLAAERGA